MVLRKPYAFLIKNFKLIHLILTGLYIYLAFRVNGILQYYNKFISGTVGKLTAINYMSSFYILAIILSMIICIVMLIVMIHKKKPKFLYIILIAAYIVVFIIMSLAISGLDTIYFSILEAKTMRLYRDLLRLILIIQYISIALTLVRGLGFDIKKFDFVKDLNEMNIEVTDDEEVELTLGNTNVVERKIRRNLREFKYYYIENKTFIVIFLSIVAIIGIFTLIINIEFVNKIYSENEMFSTDSFSMKVINSYITNKNSSGTLMDNTQNSYVIVKLNISPNTGDKNEVNTNNLILNIDNKNYKVDNKYATRFDDLGTGYNGQKITSSKEYLFLFNVPNKKLSNKILLIYGEERKVRLNPVNLDEINDTTTLKLNNDLDLSKTILKSGTININSYEIANKFTYDYTYEISGQEYTSKLNISSTSNTILKLNITSSLPDNLTPYDIFFNYGKLKYIFDNTEYTTSLIANKTPGNDKQGLYLEVDKNIEKASKIYFELNIRNQKYIYNLK